MASELSIASKQARSEEDIRILGQRNGLEVAVKHRSQPDKQIALNRTGLYEKPNPQVGSCRLGNMLKLV